LPSRALSGASALLEGASVVADQPVRSRKAPLTEAEQFEPGTVVVVVVVVGAVVVVVVAAEAGEMLRARKPLTMASVATIAVPGAACQKCQSLRL
jgi:hypothetical protein